MEFILLIFINIIMGAVFYVILRVRLEKYATDYREKRLKREMDEIIFEFNETAERNISILENRIEYLKKVLEKPTKAGNIDFSIDDTKKINKNISDVSGNVYISALSDEFIDSHAVKDRPTAMSIGYVPQKKSMESGLIYKYFSKIKYSMEKTYNTIIKHKDNDKLNRSDNLSLQQDKNFDSLTKMQPENMTGSGQLIERNDILINTDTNLAALKHKESAELSETELGEMFSLSEDKYLLISDLYNMGYTSEIISRCSGIPIGEIQLVVDLNNS